MSFTITTQGENKMWDCLSSSCVAARGGRKGGNLLDLVALMEDCSAREAAIKMADWFHITDNAASSAPAAQVTTPAPKRPPKPQLVAEEEEPDKPNKPLGFTLQGIQHDHPYLRSRGVEPDLAENFGIGFFPGKGSMAGRVVIPICNENGELVAYAGRAIDGADPKYKLPAGFHKNQVVYNLHRVLPAHGGTVVVVEGFFDCLRVWQSECNCAVALMGSSMSARQEELLARYFQYAILMLDGDVAGREAAANILPRLARHMFVKLIELPDGKQPDQLPPEEIAALLEYWR